MELVVDGCTGFWFLEWIFPTISQCCMIHDLGASDGVFLDCLQQALPYWTWPFSALCLTLMVLFRPVYNWSKNCYSWLKGCYSENYLDKKRTEGQSGVSDDSGPISRDDL